MITKISMNNVASYKSLTTLVTDKPVNLIYGLNGSGKTTISKFLHNPTSEEFNDCCIEPDNLENIIFRVYNHSFVEEVFYNQDTQKGIFTLSKENKDAENKIAVAQKNQQEIQENAEKIKEQLNQTNDKIDELTTTNQNTCFKIKQDYTGGDRILDEAEFLKGFKQKAALLDHLLTFDSKDIDKNIEEIKREVALLNSTDSDGVSLLPLVNFSADEIEHNTIFSEIILGKGDSNISGLIEKLENSDWFAKGLKYLDKSGEKCPFCQQDISQNLKIELFSYVDETYEKNVSELKRLKEEYEKLYFSIPKWDEFKDTEFISNIDEFRNNFVKIKNTYKENIKLIESKVDKPSQTINMADSSKIVEVINDEIKQANKKITAHNLKIKNKEQSLNILKNDFWQIQRNEYDSILSSYSQDLKKFNKEKIQLESQLDQERQKSNKQNQVIQEQQKQTINIDETIDNINDMLTDCGLIGFKLIKHQDHFYRIIREDDESSDKVFTSLSEGEKTMISFFYFLQLCRGNENPSETQKKIIVIDDPISSLSHIYIFNIAQIIQKEFTSFEKVKSENNQVTEYKLINRNKYEQCFILTHSLYFYYDLTDINHERRKATQKLFRVMKSQNGSEIKKMSYEDIQNDYQAYWSILRDSDCHPALLANSMRNIIEYFFNFIQKTDLNNTFNDEKLSEIRFQSFRRYISRESHSLGQNITDLKEFDYEVFREAFKLVFEKNGFSEHYKKMMRIK